MNSKVSIVRCAEYRKEELISAIKRSLDLIGGISSFISPSDKVLIKPNLLAAAIPETGIDTNPEFVRAVIKIVKDTGAKIYLGDAPSIWGSPEDIDTVYESSGMKKIASEEGVELVKFNKVSIKSGYPLTSFVDECNRIVSVPKFKTHGLMTLTGGIKNLFGLIPGLYKTELHKRALAPKDLAKIFVDIYSIVRPTISIVDGVVAMEADGPAHGGKLRNLGLVISSSDAVALDSVLASIMGLKPEDIFTTKQAYDRGLGNMHLKDIEILGEKLPDVRVSNFILPQTLILHKIPLPLLKMLALFFSFWVEVDYAICKRCQLCAKACPKAAIKLVDNKMQINHEQCVLCLCCREVCPQAAVKINKSFALKILEWVRKCLSRR